MSAHDVVLIPGDGIGTETSAAMQRVVAAAGANIDWHIEQAGAACIEEYGTPLPDRTVEAIKQIGCAIKGPVTTPVGSGFRSVNVALRKTLHLYANLRPVISIPGAGGKWNDVDLVIVRENTEDLYAGIEFQEGTEEARELIAFLDKSGKGEVSDDSAISIKPISEHASRDIVEFAFDYAHENGRKSVTAVHKANIMKHSDGLFLKTARKVAEENPDMPFSDMIIDAFCMNLVMDPKRYDVVVLPNLYGDIVSDLAAGLVGGIGLAPGANIGREQAVFEAVHGSAPDIAGKDICNPTAQILSAAMMLDHLGEHASAARIRNAVIEVYSEGTCLTGDIKRDRKEGVTPATCTEFTDALIKAVERQ